MPRRGTIEEAAQKKAVKREQAHQLKYGVDKSQELKYKNCDFCGRAVVINNYEDRRSRTPRWRKTQMVICPWCDPSNYMGTVTKPILYKTIMSRVLVEKLADKDFCFIENEKQLDGGVGLKPENCNCLGCSAKKIVAIQERRVEI